MTLKGILTKYCVVIIKIRRPQIMSLKTKAENYLYFQSIEGTRNEAKRIIFTTDENDLLKKLDDIKQSEMPSKDNTLCIKTNSNEIKDISGKYNITFNIYESEINLKLYDFENVEIQAINDTTLKILF